MRYVFPNFLNDTIDKGTITNPPLEPKENVIFIANSSNKTSFKKGTTLDDILLDWGMIVKGTSMKKRATLLVSSSQNPHPQFILILQNFPV